MTTAMFNIGSFSLKYFIKTSESIFFSSRFRLINHTILQKRHEFNFNSFQTQFLISNLSKMHFHQTARESFQPRKFLRAFICAVANCVIFLPFFRLCLVFVDALAVVGSNRNHPKHQTENAFKELIGFLTFNGRSGHYLLNDGNEMTERITESVFEAVFLSHAVSHSNEFECKCTFCLNLKIN